MSTSNGAARAEGTPFIKLAPAILAQPASQVAMTIQLEPSEVFPEERKIALQGFSLIDDIEQLPPPAGSTTGGRSECFAVCAGRLLRLSDQSYC
jgi:hypothetical protein